MTRPNFFIVGAPKCATTSLANYLRDHPNAFLCQPKEPNFFATDFPSHRHVTTETNYLKLFEDAGEACLAVGEASSWYLYSREALANIHRFDPAAKIIAMLRNPVEMIPSLHAQLLRDFAESEVDLRVALDLQEERRHGRCMPTNRNTRYDPRTLLYSDAGKFGGQIERLLDTFPREQVRIILFDDFVHDTKATYEGVLEFLDLPTDGRQKFEAVNVRRDYRSRSVGRLSYAVWSLGSRIKSRLGILTPFGVWRHVERLIMTPTPAGDIDPALRARLVDEFRPDVERLSEILGRDLSHWR